MSFKAVSSQVDLPVLESEMTNFWKENKIFEKSVEQRSQDNSFVFVDGPPFVSGMPHYGHLLTSIAKDLIPRYQTMLGKRVRRVFGWDCHGLPVEEKVNKILNIKSSKQLEEEIGIDKYIQECRNYVENVTSDWRWYVEKIGRWVDMDNAYYTMNLDFMESVLWGFKQIYQKGLVYKGKRVSLFSTDTSTPVSEFEVAMDADNYRDVEDLSVFVKFKLANLSELLDKGQDGKDVFMVAWTTTPWTIPANFALAVNENFEYALVEFNEEFLIVSKERINYTFGVKDEEVGVEKDALVRIVKTFSGRELDGLSYIPVYRYFATGDGIHGKSVNDFHVYLFSEVTNDEGTGVLHIAPAFGEADHTLGIVKGLSDFSNIDEAGKITIDPWKGIYLRDASSVIAEDMQKNGSLLRSETYLHRLPFYRGDNPLIYMSQEAYFIDVQKIKPEMLELNKKINWIPEHIKNGRFAKTVETSPDWCISRNRYWATIMPLWRSSDGDEIVVGSLEELEGLSDQITKKETNGKVKYFFEGKPMDLHKDTGDRIVLKKDGKEYKRIPEVLDVWMDSGSVPFAEYHYPFENKETFEKSRPADFIIEYTPQVRAWFSMLHRVSTIIFDDIAFKNAICHGTIAGTDGRKMSKSFGNYPDPKDVLEKYGADALRLYLMGSPIMLGGDMNFNEEGVAENYKFLLILWNSYKYFIDYAAIFDWNCDLPGANGDKANLSIMDRWILARLTQLILSVRESLDSYNVPEATRLLKEFLVNDYSTWYVRRSRDRVSSNDNEVDRNAVLSVMYGVLVAYTKLAAPVIPFIVEEMYRNLTGDLSVHLTDYPVGDKSLLDDQLIKDMDLVRMIVEQGHAARKKAEMKLRQPLNGVVILMRGTANTLSEELNLIIKDELNVKNILVNDEVLSANVVYSSDEKDHIQVGVDTKLTPELQAEGEARELIRNIQKMRKEQGLTLSDRIEVEAPEFPKDFEDYILKSTAAVKIVRSSELTIKKIID